jgi:hypothetical protein
MIHWHCTGRGLGAVWAMDGSFAQAWSPRLGWKRSLLVGLNLKPCTEIFHPFFLALLARLCQGPTTTRLTGLANFCPDSQTPVASYRHMAQGLPVYWLPLPCAKALLPLDAVPEIPHGTVSFRKSLSDSLDHLAMYSLLLYCQIQPAPAEFSQLAIHYPPAHRHLPPRCGPFNANLTGARWDSIWPAPGAKVPTNLRRGSKDFCLTSVYLAISWQTFSSFTCT